MSIKINHGYLMAPTLHMGNILQWAHQVRPQLHQVAKETLTRDLLERAGTVIDMAFLRAAGLAQPSHELDTVEVCALQYANAKQSEDRKEIEKGRRNPGVDVNVSIMALPHASGLYVLLDADNPHTIEAFRALPDVQHFSYNNSCDAPDGQSQETWEARGALWKEIIGPTLRPADRGASISLVNMPFGLMPHELPTGETVDECWMPNFKQRVFDATLNTVAGAPTEAVKHDMAKGSFGEFLAHMTRLRKGEVPEFEQMRAQVQSILPRTYARTWMELSPEALAQEAGAQLAHLRQPGP